MNLCLHCEKQTAAHYPGLCEICHSHPRIRLCYRKSRRWNAEWETHLRTLTARAKQRLPIFGETNAIDLN